MPDHRARGFVIPAERLTLTVRVGDLRTTVRLDAGRIVFEVPRAVVAMMARLDPHRDLQLAVRVAADRAR